MGIEFFNGCSIMKKVVAAPGSGSWGDAPGLRISYY